MKLDSFLISLLVFSVFVVGGSLIWGNMIDTYDLNTTTTSVGANFSDVYNVIDDSYDISQDMKNHTLGAEIEGSDQSWESLVKGSYSAIRLIKNSFTLVGNIMDEIAMALGIPSFFIKAGLVAITISILFAIIYLVFGFK